MFVGRRVLILTAAAAVSTIGLTARGSTTETVTRVVAAPSSTRSLSTSASSTTSSVSSVASIASGKLGFCGILGNARLYATPYVVCKRARSVATRDITRGCNGNGQTCMIAGYRCLWRLTHEDEAFRLICSRPEQAILEVGGT